MTEEIKQVEDSTEVTAEVAAPEASEAEAPAKRQRNRKKRVETQEVKPESEWKEQVVQIRRVTKVVKGGKKLKIESKQVFLMQKMIVHQKCISDTIERTYKHLHRRMSKKFF